MIRRAVKLVSPRYQFRSAVSGRYVSKLYALAHPATTYAVRRVTS